MIYNYEEDYYIYTYRNKLVLVSSKFKNSKSAYKSIVII